MAVWQERARGAASGAGRPGRLEGMGPAGKVAGREQRRGGVELLCLQGGSGDCRVEVSSVVTVVLE